jgi:hypothetical protein
VAVCTGVEQILIQAGLIDALQVQSARGYQRQWGCPLSQAVVDLGFAAEPADVGHGGDAHAPNEYLVIESANPEIRGYDDAVRAFVDYLYALAR